MGSGSNSIYSGTGGGSQPYAEQYSVYVKMLKSLNKVNDALQKMYDKNPQLI